MFLWGFILSIEEIEVRVQNIVSSIDLGRPLDLKYIADKLEPEGAEYDPRNFPGLIFRLKKPKAAFLIFGTGKLVCTGTQSEKEAYKALERIISKLEKIGIKVSKEPKLKVENIVASVDIKRQINLEKAIIELEGSNYEPEQFPGLIYRQKNPKATFLLFRTGKLVCTGTKKLEEIYKAVYRVREELAEKDLFL